MYVLEKDYLEDIARISKMLDTQLTINGFLLMSVETLIGQGLNSEGEDYGIENKTGNATGSGREHKPDSEG